MENKRLRRRLPGLGPRGWADDVELPSFVASNSAEPRKTGQAGCQRKLKIPYVSLAGLLCIWLVDGVLIGVLTPRLSVRVGNVRKHHHDLYKLMILVLTGGRSYEKKVVWPISAHKQL